MAYMTPEEVARLHPYIEQANYPYAYNPETYEIYEKFSIGDLVYIDIDSSVYIDLQNSQYSSKAKAPPIEFACYTDFGACLSGRLMYGLVHSRPLTGDAPAIVVAFDRTSGYQPNWRLILLYKELFMKVSYGLVCKKKA